MSTKQAIITGLDAFTTAYLDCALWAGLDEQQTGYCVADMTTYTILQCRAECAAFQREARELLQHAYAADGYDDAQAGHDFWLTRNHHGVGFWDRDLGDIGDKLTTIAEACGGRSLYVQGGKVGVE